MQFNSLEYLLFFPVVTLVFFIVPKKFRAAWLLVASYYFYMSWNARYAILIFASTLITYLAGLSLSGERLRGKTAARKLIVGGCVAINLLILGFFKYFDFALDNVNRLLSLAGLMPVRISFSIILPVGISFYTFQALSYVLDVYRGDTPAEKSLLRYALFVSFFPQLVAGPIERSKNLIMQIDRADAIRWDGRRVTDGLKIIVYGLFLKVVLADHLAIYVNDVFENYGSYGGAALLIAAVFFAFQIYCDFNSYSLIAIGSAKILGFTLMENFNAPYFARSVAEFWRRWHISLSTWFRDYLYIPLGGGRCARWRRYCNLLIVFAVSGLWHGASWSFVAWGVLNGLYQVLGDALKPAKERIHKRLKTKTGSMSFRLLQTVTTFALIDFAWIFFRMDNIRHAFAYIERIFTRFDPWNFLYGNCFYSLSRAEFTVTVFALLFMLLVDLLKYKRKQDLHQALNAQSVWFRWGVYIALIAAIFVFGVYGPEYVATEFIYFQF